METPTATRYRAFLSYSHKDDDWADWLHSALENYRIDRDLVGRQTTVGAIPRTLRPIFRDRDDFSGGKSLVQASLDALSMSDFLVVICSPNAARSHYVNEEVRTFKAMGGASKVVPFIVDGEPGDGERECFPPALKFVVAPDGRVTDRREERIAADARESADGREIAKEKVVAGLLGIGLDEIRRRAVRAHRRRMAALGAVAVVMAVLAAAAGIAARVARSRTIEAQQRLEWALETAGSVTAKAATFKDKFGVPVPVLTDLLQEIERLLGRLVSQGVSQPQLTFAEAKLLQQLSDSNRDLGNSTKALDQLQEAVTKLQAVAAQSNSLNAKNELGWTYLRMADLLAQQLHGRAADEKLEAARMIFATAATDPNDAAPLIGLSATLQRLSRSLASKGDLRAALAAQNQEIEIYRRLPKGDPDNGDVASRLAGALGNRGAQFQQSGQLQLADESFKEALEIADRLAKRDRANAGWAALLANARTNVGLNAERQGNLAGAIFDYDAVREIRQSMSRQDPTNITKQKSLAAALDQLGYAYDRMARLDDAASTFAEMVSIRRKIVARDPADADGKVDLTYALSRLGYVQNELGNASAALSSIEEANRLGAELIRLDPDNDAVKYDHVANLGMLAALRDAKGDAAGGTAAIEEMVRLSDGLAKRDPTNASKLFAVTSARLMLGARYRGQKRLQDSLAIVEAAQQSAQARLKDAPKDVNWLMMLSSALEQAYLTHWDIGDIDKAIADASRFADVARRWADVDTANTLPKQRLANAYSSMGNAALRQKKYGDARQLQIAALDIRKALAKSDSSNTGYAVDEVASWTQLNAALSEAGDYPAALDAAREALAIQQRLVGKNPSNIEWRSAMAATMFSVGSAQLRLGRGAEASASYRSAASEYATLGDAFTRLGRPVEADRYFAIARSIRDALAKIDREQRQPAHQ